MRFLLVLAFLFVAAPVLAEDTTRNLGVKSDSGAGKAKKDVVPKVDFWTERQAPGNDSTRNLVVDDKPVFKSGDKVWFKFKSNVDGYAYLANKGTDGKVNLLFPGIAGDKNKVEADKDFTVPGDKTPFEFDSTPGREQVVLVVSPKPIEALEKIAKSTGKNDTGAELTAENKRAFDEVIDKGTISADKTDDASRNLTVHSGAGQHSVAEPNAKGAFSQPVMVKLDLEHR